METARIEQKKRRKAERKAQKERAIGRPTAPPAGRGLLPLSQEGAFELVAASDNSQSLPKHDGPVQVDEGEETQGDTDKDDDDAGEEPAPRVEVAVPAAGPSTAVKDEARTPQVSASRRLGPSVSRTTPWLGSSTPSKTALSTGKRAIRTLEGTDGDMPIAVNTPTAKPQNTLARDRGATPVTLRKAVLQKYPSATGLQTPDVSESSRKRRFDEFEGMTPEQKAMHLRRLNKMTATEKRAYYAEYKGKGRYLTPDQV